MKPLFMAVALLLSYSSFAEGPAVIVNTIKKEKVTPDIEIAGRIRAVQRIEIIPRVGGILEQRHFVEGSRVKKDDPLFSIEKVTYEIQLKQAQAALLSAKASLKQASAELSRQQKLRKSGATSKAQLESAEAQRDQSKSQVLQAEAQLQQAQLNLGYTDIKSPIDGKIGSASINTGNLIAANSSNLATIVQTDPVYVDISVSNKILLEARRASPELQGSNMIPQLLLSNGEKYEFDGEFDFLSPEVNTETDSVAIRAQFPNPNELLLPGEFVRVTLEPKNAPEVVTVSQAAVQRDRDGYMVLVVNNQQVVEQRRVTLGEQMGSNWIVVSGLEAGERVITQGLQKVKNGQTVEAVEQ
ncbi:MAG: efflux RND transporter periplasmic adaptor subunit [Saccharospirillaceae bacterium]|nr:efflux RND transporter periplasmic adaptor subunit [Saccharospirillaceae bacterium]